jgi:hypothetical protein
MPNKNSTPAARKTRLPRTAGPNPKIESRKEIWKILQAFIEV